MFGWPPSGNEHQSASSIPKPTGAVTGEVIGQGVSEAGGVQYLHMGRYLVSNLEYWSNRAGEDYRSQQDSRRSNNNHSYALQEAWLVDFVRAFHTERRGARLRVLDYGCGFGRFAHILSTLDFVDYFGFDFSPSMTAPLFECPPASIKDVVSERVRVSGRLEDAFPVGETFDLIFTVSVLIHNQPSVVQGMLSAMMDRLAPHGKLVLIENPFTSVSVLENLYHGGCWCHAFPRYFDGKADVDIIDGFADRHGIYVASLIGGERKSRFLYRESAQASGVTLDLTGLLLRGLDRAEEYSQRILSDLNSVLQDGGSLVGSLRDAEENQNNLERELSAKNAHEVQLHEHIESQGRQIAELSGALSAVTARFTERQKMLASLGAVINDRRQAKSFTTALSGDDRKPSATEAPLPYSKNLPQDIRYSWKIPALDKVLHLFHAEWYGIRAAVGSLPGNKIAISANQAQSDQVAIDLYNEISRMNCQKIIVHGYSMNMSKVVSYLSKMGLGDELYIVKHGSPAQWGYEPERRAAFEVLELAKAGRVRRVHFMKAGFEIFVPRIFKPLLFNMSPLFQDFPSLNDVEQGSSIVFAPGWAEKNLYTGLMAACTSKLVDRIWIYANGVEIPNSVGNKVVHHKYLNREQTFDLIKSSSICMNASVIDSHPMVNIEAQSLGKACIRGRLNLDFLEDHPYVRLTETNNAMSIEDVRNTVERVLAVPKAEMKELTCDYQANSDSVARRRYLEFLEI